MGSLYGYEIASELPLRRLLPAPGPRGRIELRRAEPPLPSEGPVVHALADGASSFTLTRVGDRLHVDCSASGEFLVDGPVLLAAPPAECEPDLWEHRVVTTVVPLAIAELGGLMLHGAAVVSGGRAVVLAGTTGRGKSTAALAAGRAGLQVLAEDGVAIDGEVVWPGPLGVRVAPEGRKQTVFLDEAAHAHEPVPLGAVVVLGERAASLTVEPIGGVAAVPLVLPHLIYGGFDRLSTAFAQCAVLVAGAPVFRAALPDGLDVLPAALEELLSRVAA